VIYDVSPERPFMPDCPTLETWLQTARRLRSYDGPRAELGRQAGPNVHYAFKLRVIGLVVEGAVEQDSGPEKYVYVITAAGHSALAEWFESCITKV
jgi:hypothetical protein